MKKSGRDFHFRNICRYPEFRLKGIEIGKREFIAKRFAFCDNNAFCIHVSEILTFFRVCFILVGMKIAEFGMIPIHDAITGSSLIAFSKMRIAGGMGSVLSVDNCDNMFQNFLSMILLNAI
ncbi:hypothetical protein MTYM_01891 [Methylococcales bacterium]|nr:hypothetical protein MTYM_01891 [Methylococcales bacterium]